MDASLHDIIETGIIFCVLFLVRERIKGIEFMHKQELIDAAEASGLSRVAIAYDDLITLF